MKISKEFKIGLFAIIAISLLYLGFNFLKGIDFFSSNNKYYTVYENIDGLQVSNSVIISGLAVGRVSDITFIQGANSKIVVELDIKGNIVLDDSTKAFLISEGLLGGKAIELIIPKIIHKPLDDGDTIQSDVAIGLMQSITEQTLPVAEDLGALFKKISITLDNFHETELILQSTLQKTNLTIDATRYAINENRKALNASLENISELTNNLKESSKQLTPLLKNANILVDSLKQVELAKAFDDLSATAESLNEILSAMKSGEGTMGKLLYDDSLYVNLSQSAEDLDKLLVDFRENPSRYVQVSVFGKKDKSEKKNK